MANDVLPTIELDTSNSDQIKQAFKLYGAFHLKAPKLVSEGESLLELVKELFSLSETEKLKYQLDKDTNYSGYSLLKNERDLREQFHLFSSFLNQSQTSDPIIGLKLPNQAPQCLGLTWSNSVNDYIESKAKLARKILKSVLNQSISDELINSSTSSYRSYNLLKMIHYFKILDAENNKTGTPPHIDWSLLTIVMQDEMPGLSILVNGNQWVEIDRKEDCFIVLAGELLEIATRGEFLACPHRVILPDSVKERYSAPFFYCPDLDSDLAVMPIDNCANDSSESQHVHRVFQPGEVMGNFQFGATEFNRKKFGRWCYSRSCC